MLNEETVAIGRGYRTIEEAISATVMNVGPFGKDPHQICKRLHTKSIFEEIPILLASVIEQLNTCN